MRRLVGIVTHNWPLKLAAVVLATLLYAGLVVSQNAQSWGGRVPIVPLNQPESVFLIGNLGDVTNIRYFAPRDVADRLSAASFSAYVDLSDAAVPTSGGFSTFNVQVHAADPRVQILDFDPRQVQVQLDPLVSKMVPVEVDRGTVPAGLQVRDPVVEPSEVTASGPQSFVSQVTRAVARVLIQPAGISIDQSVDLEPVDGRGQTVTQVKLEPSSAHVQILVGNQLGSKSLPVNPVVIGTPAVGYEVSSVTVTPTVATIEGEVTALAELSEIDTAPVSISGASADVAQTVALAVPDGMAVLGSPNVSVRVRLRAVTGTRTISAGIVLLGARPDRTYVTSTDAVSVTVGGKVADLSTLSGAAVVATADVTGLEPGTHQVPLRVTLPAGLTVVAISPARIVVTVGSVATPTPVEPPAAPSPSPSSQGVAP